MSKKLVTKLSVVSALTALAANAQAALSPADEALIKSGLTSSDAVFYSIGGAVLVVLAGIWGFKKVMRMIG